LKGATATVMMQTTDKGYGETDLHDKALKYHPGIDLKGPVPMAVAAEWPLPDQPNTTARLVVFGNSTFITNQMVQAPGNIDLGLNSFSWAVGDDSKISIHPKEDTNRVLNLSNVGASFIGYFTIMVLPGAVLIAGIVIWWRRRSL
jgi:ABC-2 type transport system permease protein